MRWLVLQLHAPLASFGDVAIDSRGRTRNYPAKSMLVGLFANALGWTRSMAAKHQSLQDRLIFGAAYDEREVSEKITDYQTADLEQKDKAWSTTGEIVVRYGGPNTYTGSHQRWREYLVDLRVFCVVRLIDDQTSPSLEDLGDAVQYPARPLFIGRKNCLPTAPIFRGWVQGQNVIDALVAASYSETEFLKASWSASEGKDVADRVTLLTDERNWFSGLHGGAREICEGRIKVES